MKAIYLAWTLLFLAACAGTGKAPECQDNADCNNQACVENQCVDVDCLSSADCSLKEYCHGEDFVCTSGCSEDTDCLAGEMCDVESNTCEPYGCRETELDCPVGDFCNQNTGECYDDPEGTCNTCSAAQNEAEQLELLFGGTLSGRHCVQWDEFATEFYYFKTCNPNGSGNDCPRGFACVPEVYDLYFGTPVNLCLGDCSYYREIGEI